MLLIYVFWLTTEHCQGETFLDELVAVYGRGNRADESLGDVALASGCPDFFLLFISELDNVLIAEASEVVNFDHGLEDGESVLYVREVVIPVDVDTVDFDFVARAGHVNEVVQHVDFFLAGNSTRRNCAWSLLDCEFLVIPVDSFDLVNCVGAASLADDALGQTLSSLDRVGIVDRSLQVTALATEEYLAVLRENVSTLSDDATEFDEGIQMDLAQLSQLVLHGQVIHSHEELAMELNVIWEDLLDDVEGDLIEDRKHVSRLLRQPNGKSWLLRGQVCEVDFERLFVLLTHIGDAVFVNMDAVFLKDPQEGSECFLDVLDDFLLAHPLVQGFFRLSVVVQVGKFSVVFDLLSTAHHASLAPSGVAFILRKFFVVCESSRTSALTVVADPPLHIKVTLSSSALVDCHRIVILVVKASVLVLIKLWHLTVIAEKWSQKIKDNRGNPGLLTRRCAHQDLRHRRAPRTSSPRPACRHRLRFHRRGHRCRP